MATVVQGKLFRMMLGHWPLMTVKETRSQAMEVLSKRRSGERPSRPIRQQVPTLKQAVDAHCRDKKIKASSHRRYESFYRTHFASRKGPSPQLHANP